MFDLVSFIRQYMPPQKRTAVTLALTRLLFSPINFLFQVATQTRDQLITQAQATGQVLVLEELLNRVAFGSAIGSVYVLDGNFTTVDFQVIVPPGTSASVISNLTGVVDAYRLPGKRYEIVTAPAWTAPTKALPNWEKGYPFLNASGLTVAIDVSGVYQVEILQDGNQVVFREVTFLAGYPVAFPVASTANYTVTIGGTLTVNLTGSADIGVINRVSFQRLGNAFIPVVQVTTGDVEIWISGRDGTVYNDTIQVGEVYDAKIDNIDYNRRRVYSMLSDGFYKLNARMKGQQAVTALDITLSSAVPNQPPYVAKQVAGQSVTVGTSYALTIPADSFVDPDGSLSNVQITGLPVGVSSSINGLAISISGTPSTVGNNLVTVTATDNLGATAAMSFQIQVLAVDAPKPVDPIKTKYTYKGIPAGGYPSTNLGILDVEHKFENGRVKIVRDRANPSGGTVKYLVDGIYKDSIAGISRPPQLPILIQKFLVDLGRPQSQWRNDPVINATQCIRYL
jgi:hypothetical protein